MRHSRYILFLLENVETKHPLQQGLRHTSTCRGSDAAPTSKPNIHYNKDCDITISHVLFLYTCSVETKHPLQQGLRPMCVIFLFFPPTPVETKHPLQQGLRRETEDVCFLGFFCRNQTSTTTRIATNSCCSSSVLVKLSKPNIHYNKDCDTMRGVYFYVGWDVVETKHPLQQGLRQTTAYPLIIFQEASKPNIHYNKDCDLKQISKYEVLRFLSKPNIHYNKDCDQLFLSVSLSGN